MHAITLAVTDLDRSVSFYRAVLGIEGSGVIGTEYPATDTRAGGATAMFTLDDGLIVSVYGRDDMRKDSGVELGVGPSSTVGHFVPSESDVDAVLQRAHDAGGTVPGAAYTRSWGMYSGFFQDPDGHLWEVVANPTGADPAANTERETQPLDPESIE